VTNATYTHQPDWYRNFQYDQERARGLDFAEDLAAPGVFQWDLSSGEAVCILAAEGHENDALPADETPAACVERLRAGEQQRRKAPSRLERATGAYLVQRGSMTRGTSCCSGRAPYQKGCYRIVFPIPARRPNTMPSTRRCGS
jgi:hypothetical protein